ncbi:MAG: type III pantothenate kinase [candidate division WOR-3 bacterium]
MILVFDIGNSNIHIGLYDKGKLRKIKICPRKDGLPENFLKKSFIKKNIKGAGIASVVPEMNYELSRFLKKNFAINPFFVNYKIRMPVIIAYKNLGADRIANINGAYIRYKSDLIVFSIGTAITGDVVSKTGIHYGGLIMPGFETQLWSLRQKTALIKKVALGNSAPLLGKNTNECVLSGIINGIKFSVEGFIAKTRRIYKKDFLIIATGGNADKFCQLMPGIDKCDTDLTIYGIYQLYRQNVKN